VGPRPRMRTAYFRRIGRSERADSMLDPSDLERRRRPEVGDHVTLFTIPEICYWTRQGASTIRRWIASGKIGVESITRPGGKIFMTGDQLARLIASWAGQQAATTETKPPPRRRVRRHDPHKPPAAGRR
jgi:hypothetical protein